MELCDVNRLPAHRGIAGEPQGGGMYCEGGRTASGGSLRGSCAATGKLYAEQGEAPAHFPPRDMNTVPDPCAFMHCAVRRTIDSLG